jgi:hypothetical protein
MKTVGPGHAIVRRLLLAFSQGDQPGVGSHEPFVTEQDARDAVLQLAIVLDQSYTEQAPLTEDRLEHGMRLLAVLREYVTPLDLEGNDLEGLRQVPAQLEQARTVSGMRA